MKNNKLSSKKNQELLLTTHTEIYHLVREIENIKNIATGIQHLIEDRLQPIAKRKKTCKFCGIIISFGSETNEVSQTVYDSFDHIYSEIPM